MSNIFEWLSNNYTWLLSGVGTLLIGYLIDVLIRRNRQHSKKRNILTHDDFSPGVVEGDYKIEIHGDHSPGVVQGDYIHVVPPHNEIKLSEEPLYPMIPICTFDDFVGREDEIEWLKEKLIDKNESIVAITGNAVLYGGGGIGKTFLAGVFAKTTSLPNGYLTVFVGERSVENVALEILKKVDYSGEEPNSPTDAQQLLKKHLASSFNGLLILDNVDNQLAKYLIPGGKVKTLITTRDRNIAREFVGGQGLLQLKEFKLKESINLFKKYIEISDNNLEEYYELAGFLGNLPYAIALAARQLANNLFLSPRKLIEPIRSYHDIQKKVDMLLEKSFSKLSPTSKQLLVILSCCSSKGITMDLFKQISNIEDKILKDAILESEKLSLVYLIKEKDDFTLKLHPLTRFFLRRQDDQNRSLEQFLCGLFNIVKINEGFNFYVFEEIVSCFSEINENKLDHYTKILDYILTQIKFNKYLIISILSNFIKKNESLNIPKKQYIKYYKELSKQYKLVKNYKSALECIDKEIEFREE